MGGIDAHQTRLTTQTPGDHSRSPMPCEASVVIRAVTECRLMRRTASQAGVISGEREPPRRRMQRRPRNQGRSSTGNAHRLHSAPLKPARAAVATLCAVDTFVIRLWTPADDSALAAGPCGVAQHVASGRSGRFRDGNQLLVLLDGLRQDDDETARSGATRVIGDPVVDCRGRLGPIEPRGSGA